ncbi:MAG: EpsG family protein [Aeriscardovia sp.]|nr:EpsG family protein [Aeriscardovia sp.]
MIYLLLISLLICLIIRYDINGVVEYKKEWYLFVLILLILMSGLRYRLGVDTISYLYSFYHQVPMLHKITIEDFAYGKDPLFMLMNSLVKTIGGKFYIVQLVHATIVNTLIFSYFRRYSKYLFTCVLLYYVTVFFVLNMEEMRASLSVALSLFANDYIMKRKWLKGVALYGTCCLFHASSVILLLFIPIISFIRFNFKGLLILFALAVSGIFAMQFIMDNYQEIIDIDKVVDNKIAFYLKDEMYTEGNLNVIGIIVSFLSLLYPLYYLFYLKKYEKESRLLNLEPFLMIFILISIMSFQIPIVYRFVRFYSVYNILFVSSFFMCLLHKQSTLSIGIRSLRALIIILPFIYNIMKGYSDVKTYARYYPYASILDMEINEQRERVFMYLKGERTSPIEY